MAILRSSVRDLQNFLKDAGYDAGPIDGIQGPKTVRALQRFLKDQGHDPGPIDGIMGSKTKGGIRSFQSSQGISADGIIGPQTLSSFSGAQSGTSSGGSSSQPAKDQPTDREARREQQRKEERQRQQEAAKAREREIAEAKARAEKSEEKARQAQEMRSRERATDIIRGMLNEYGLEYSAGDIDEWVGLLSDDPNNMVLIEEQIRRSDEFGQRFPGIQERLDRGFNAITPEEYIQLEDAYRSVLRQAGFHRGFYDDPEDMARFIANDMSPSELEQRVSQGVIAARNAPEEVRSALEQFYGISNSEAALAEYYLDPERGLEAVEREFESAVLAGAASRTGFGDISQEQAEGLQSIGIDVRQAQQGFTQLAENREVFTSGVGEVGGDRISRDAQMDAAFRGDAFQRDRIRRQRERRLAAFTGEDAGAIQSREGLVGLRSSST